MTTDGAMEHATWCGGAYEWERVDHKSAGAQMIEREALRRLLARQAHADTVAKAASQVIAGVDTSREHGADLLSVLRRLIRAVIDGPEAKGDSAHVELKAYRPAIDVAREFIAKRNAEERDPRAKPGNDVEWLAGIISALREDPPAAIKLREPRHERCD